MKVIENAKQAKTTWDEKIDEKTKEKFRKYFHLSLQLIILLLFQHIKENI